MLIGEVSHTIDAKGRYIVPAKFRDDLGERFIVTKGFEHCLFVYTLAAWQEAMTTMSTLSTTNAEARKFARNFFSGAAEVEIDKQFRILLPVNLREHAGLSKEIVTIGVANKLEIWDKQRWQQYLEGAAEEYESAAENFVGLNI